MYKKVVALAMVLSLCFCALVSCKPRPNSPVTSDSASSAITSSEATSSESIDTSGWGSEDDYLIIRPVFLSADSQKNVFYCATSGGVYKQFFDSNKLSKIYSNNKYDSTSVQVLSDSRVCVGFKNEAQSGFITFDLNQKTVANAVSDPSFANKNIYSLVHFNNTKYFLSNPDRYGRFTLYKEVESRVSPIASGVNEFMISRNRIFYNIGSNIFSVDLNGEDMHIVTTVETSDLLGFTIAGDMLIYMSSKETFYLRMSTMEHEVISTHLNVYTCATAGDTAFFCGADGGIYSMSLVSGQLKKVSSYTASSIAAYDGWLYLSPADKADYPDVDEKYIISGGVHRFLVEELMTQDEPTSSEPTTSSLSQSDVSSGMAVIETEEKAPEFFGK